ALRCRRVVEPAVGTRPRTAARRSRSSAGSTDRTRSRNVSGRGSLGVRSFDLCDPSPPVAHVGGTRDIIHEDSLKEAPTSAPMMGIAWRAFLLVSWYPSLDATLPNACQK